MPFLIKLEGDCKVHIKDTPIRDSLMRKLLLEDQAQIKAKKEIELEKKKEAK